MNHLKLPIFRMVSGVKTPYVLVLDAARVVVDEYVDSAALAVVLRDMKQPVMVSPATLAKSSTLAAWFEPGDNPIPGTDRIREECLAKIKTAMDASCSGCELNTIRTEYRTLLENAKLI